MGTYSDNSTQNLTTAAAWASTDTSTATVSVVGVATPIANGSVTISATMGTITGSTLVTVTGFGSSNVPRYQHSATVLDSGLILIAGGSSGSGPFSGPMTEAELYRSSHRAGY